MPVAEEQNLHRKHALEIFQSALRSADPGRCVRQALLVDNRSLRIGTDEFPLESISRLIIVGAGKATPAMAVAVEEVLGERISAGAINTKYGHGLPLRQIETTECGHPLPDQNGQAGTERMLTLLEGLDEQALVLCLFSGGGSALLPAPAGISLQEKQDTTEVLLRCGATIDQINAIRKHLSRVKGGQLARLAFPARVVSLLLSDVIGDRLDAIASGPAHPDSTTFCDCLELVDRFQLTETLPERVTRRLREGAAGKIQDTPREGDACFERVSTHVIGNNRLAVEAAIETAKALGYRTMVLSTTIEGEAREVAGVHAAIGREIQAAGRPLEPPACVVSGGETTVTLNGDGKGGRNQEFALAAALRLEGTAGITIMSGGTDGTDGPTDAAGALCDGATVARGQHLGLQAARFLANNDSYTYFNSIDDLIISGPTNTNVMDLQLILVS